MIPHPSFQNPGIRHPFIIRHSSISRPTALVSHLPFPRDLSFRLLLFQGLTFPSAGHGLLYYGDLYALPAVKPHFETSITTEFVLPAQAPTPLNGVGPRSMPISHIGAHPVVKVLAAKLWWWWHFFRRNEGDGIDEIQAFRLQGASPFFLNPFRSSGIP